MPEPKCTPVPTSINLSIEDEVMVMSMLYPNNTLNSELHSINREKIPTPMCQCGESGQTIHHVLFTCKNVETELRLFLQTPAKSRRRECIRR